MNTPFYKNRKVQLLSLAVSLLLFGCGQASQDEVLQKSKLDYSASAGGFDNDNIPVPTPTPVPSSSPQLTLNSAVVKAILQNLNSVSYSCNASELKLKWPVGGAQSVDWASWYYFDLDYSNGVADYAGGYCDQAKTYDGSPGIDLALPSFRQMDAGKPVYAAAAGIIVAVKDNGYDRSFGNPPSNCGVNTNYIVMQHANGYTTTYLHLRKNSSVFAVGTKVLQGQKIAEIGSSGCSSQPHLHFEVQDCQHNPVDPFDSGMWLSGTAPAYDAPFKIMDIAVKEGAFSNAQIVDPPANLTSTFAGRTIGVALAVAGAKAGDKIKVQIMKPNGSIPYTWNQNFISGSTFSQFSLDYTLDATAGTWAILFHKNGSLTQSFFFQVNHLPLNSSNLNAASALKSL